MGQDKDMVRAKYYREENTRREPEEITEVLGTILERIGSGADRHVATVVSEWKAIAPGRWITDARPAGIRRGVLLVEVASGAVATLLRHDTEALLERISGRFEPGVVEAVRVQVSRRPESGKTP